MSAAKSFIHYTEVELREKIAALEINPSERDLGTIHQLQAILQNKYHAYSKANTGKNKKSSRG